MSDHSGARPRGGILTWALWGAALIGVAAVLYIIARASTKPEQQVHVGPVPPKPAVEDVARKLQHTGDGQPPPAYVFKDGRGRSITAASFRGKVVVMNLWATWCAPCKQEMPTLARLQQAYRGKPLVVVAISIDQPQAADEARRFVANLPPLGFYNDPAAKLPWALKPTAEGVPTTVIYGADGLERGRVSGAADWSGAGARAVIDHVLAER